MPQKSDLEMSLFWRIIAINKIRIARGYSYVSAFAIPFLVARELERVFPVIPWYITFPLAAIGIWIVGLIDTEKGGLEAESEFAFYKNPKWMKYEKKQDEKNNDD